MTRRLWKKIGSLLAAAAFLWLAVLTPAFAAELGAAPEGVRSAEVFADMSLQLDALAPISPSRDLAAALWRAYSVPNLPPSRALAASLLMGMLVKPQVLPALAPALAKASAARKAGAADGEKIVARLVAVAGKYKNDPQSLHAVKALTAPLRKTLSRRAARRGVPEDLKPAWNAVFDGTAARPPPTAASVLPGRAGASLRKAAERGAGTRNFGRTPGQGGIKPINALSPGETGRLAPMLKKISAAQSPGPLILSQAALRRLQPGRTAASRTASYKKTRKAAGRNFAAAAELVNRRVRQGRDLDAGLMISLNRILRRGLISYKNAARPGEIRIMAAQRVGHQGARAWFEYAKPRRVFSYLADFMVWYEANKDRLHPVVLAAESYQQLIRIHPFGDGNGRTARLVMDFVLQRNGYPPAIFSGASKSDAVHKHTGAVVRSVARGVLRAARRMKP